MAGPVQPTFSRSSAAVQGESVSVVITAWNRKRFLGDALASVHFEPSVSGEIVVVANFHDDDLEREVQSRGGVWVLSHQSLQGAMTADGIRAASGSILAFLDDDDIFHPFRMSQIMTAFAKDAALGFYHNGHMTFREGERPTFPASLGSPPLLRIPPDQRKDSDCERIWLLEAGYNGSSTVVRRDIVAPFLSELSQIRKGVPPYLFYRAWVSPVSIVMDPRQLTAVRIHSENTTPNSFLNHRARFGRLVSISTDLSADARTIQAFVPQNVWSVPLRQMSSMGQILAAVHNSSALRRDLAESALELLRRRRTWLPRWTLLSLAAARILSQRGALFLFSWLTTPT